MASMFVIHIFEKRISAAKINFSGDCARLHTIKVLVSSGQH